MADQQKMKARIAKSMAKDAVTAWTKISIAYAVVAGFIALVSFVIGLVIFVIGLVEEISPITTEVMCFGYLVVFLVSVFPLNKRWVTLDEEWTGVKTLWGKNLQRVGPGLSWLPPFVKIFKLNSTRMTIESVSDTDFSRTGSITAAERTIGIHLEHDSLSIRGRNPAILSGGVDAKTANEEIDTFDKQMLLGQDFTVFVEGVDAAAWRKAFGDDLEKGWRKMAHQVEDRSRAIVNTEISKLSPRECKLKSVEIGNNTLRQLEEQVGDPDTDAGSDGDIDKNKVTYQGFNISAVKMKPLIYPDNIVKAQEEALAALEARKKTLADADAKAKAEERESEGKAAAITNVSTAQAAAIERLGVAERKRRKDLTDQIVESRDPAMAAMVARQENFRESVEAAKGSNLVAIGSDADLSTATAAAIAASTAVDVAKHSPKPKGGTAT